jgi:hypothetical protein
MLFDIDKTIPFLRSVSYAIVAQRTTQLEWKADEGGLATLYNAFQGVFGTPGSVVVRTASDAQMRREVELETRHRIDVLLTRFEAGPTATAKYLRDLEEIRTSALASLRQQYQEAITINREIAREWGQSISLLADIECWSTVSLKALEIIPGPGWAVSLGYDVLHGAITDLDEAGRANSIATVVSSRAFEEGGKKIGEQAADALVNKLNGQATEAELKHALARLRQLEGKLTRQMERLALQSDRLRAGVGGQAAQQSVDSLGRQIPRNLEKVNAAQKTVVKSAGKVALAHAVSWIFLAGDIKQAFDRRNRLQAGAAW